MAAVRTKTKTTEKSDEAKIRRAHEARMLMDNPQFKDALESIYDFWDTYWKKTSPADVEGRELAHKMLLAHGAFVHVLTRTLEDGTVSEATAEEAKKLAGLAAP